MVLGNCASIQGILRGPHGAPSYYEEALNILRSLVNQGYKKYRHQLGLTLTNFSHVQCQLGNLEAAEQGCLEALTIRRTLARRDAITFRPLVGITLSSLTSIRKH